jgi:hypothetical protein
MAYTIYDDLMDGDGRPELLPIANWGLINTVHTFEDICHQVNFIDGRGIYGQMLTTMEKANFREITRYRFDPEKFLKKSDLPNYPYSLKIAEKSLPHITGPIIQAYMAKWDKPKIKKLELMLVNYLAARQLNDDAHDIADDLAKGHLSYPGWVVLGEYFTCNPIFDPKSKKDQDRLLTMLWTKSISKITTKIKANIQTSRRYYREIFTDTSFPWFLMKLKKLEMAAEKARTESNDSIKFIAQF